MRKFSSVDSTHRNRTFSCVLRDYDWPLQWLTQPGMHGKVCFMLAWMAVSLMFASQQFQTVLVMRAGTICARHRSGRTSWRACCWRSLTWTGWSKPCAPPQTAQPPPETCSLASACRRSRCLIIQASLAETFQPPVGCMLPVCTPLRTMRSGGVSRRHLLHLPLLYEGVLRSAHSVKNIKSK